LPTEPRKTMPFVTGSSFADYIRRVDVPGVEFLPFSIKDRRSRYLSNRSQESPQKCD